MAEKQRQRRLAERAGMGDEQAFAELVRACRRMMYAAAFAITRNEQDALDAVQEAILRGWRKLSDLRDAEYVQTWLTRIAIRCAQTIAKRRRPAEELAEHIPAPSHDHERALDVRRAIANLDDKTRLCAVLFYIEDLPIERVAELTGVRLGTVKSRLFRARERLRAALEVYRDE